MVIFQRSNIPYNRAKIFSHFSVNAVKPISTRNGGKTTISIGKLHFSFVLYILIGVFGPFLHFFHSKRRFDHRFHWNFNPTSVMIFSILSLFEKRTAIFDILGPKHTICYAKQNSYAFVTTYA